MDKKSDKVEKITEQILKDVTPQQMVQLVIEILRELENIHRYLKKIYYSSNDHIQFQKHITARAFYENVVERIEKIIEWNDEKEKQLKKEMEEEKKNIENKTWQEKRDIMKSAVKAAKTSGKIAAGIGIGAIIAGYFYKKSKKKKDAGK